jgi:hypothetical protein
MLESLSLLILTMMADSIGMMVMCGHGQIPSRMLQYIHHGGAVLLAPTFFCRPFPKSLKLQWKVFKIEMSARSTT